MKRAVLDEVVPSDLAAILSDRFLSVDVFPGDWRSLADAEVIARASAAGYDWLITCDKQMPFQQNLAGHEIAVLVLPSQRAPLLESLRDLIADCLSSPVRGCFVLMDDSGMVRGDPAPHLQGSKA